MCNPRFTHLKSHLLGYMASGKNCFSHLMDYRLLIGNQGLPVRLLFLKKPAPTSRFHRFHPIQIVLPGYSVETSLHL
jgi:hypothetical protein